MKTKCMSCGGTMKKMQKGGSTKKKPLLKDPSQGFFKDLNTRLQATLTKIRESPGSAGPFVGDGNQSMLKKEHRKMWEQKNLNQDLKLHLYKKQQAKLEKEKKIAEKNKMLKLQNKKGSYSKQGFKVGGMTKMQKGGVTRPIPGQKKPVTREYKITRAMTNGVKSPNLPPLDSKYLKKRSTGVILKDKSKLQEGTYKPTMQNGGFPITAKAAARKVAKGKGMMTYNYGTKDVPGSDGNKGAYVKFAKNQEPNPYGGKTLQGRSRRVMQKGGIAKKK